MAHIEPIALHKTTQERYLNYAMSVITSRALPDVRDGLKPVQRRILYGMFTNLKVTHDAKPRKSAAIVGEVMGKYHPHGDQSIYDAMVRMAQWFSLRYPLVDGHGNFGSLDGDNAAAMRYTEARLAPLAGELLNEIKKETVAFRPNYDSTVEEPVVLPSQTPNLIVNGATGIAVGMATNIPPHNLNEVLSACIALIGNRNMKTSTLVSRHIKGPDFPTGGVMTTSEEEIVEIYKTGSGPVTVRAEWEVEKDGRKRSIVFTSIPYTVNKSTLIEKIALHIQTGKLPQILDVRDESTDDIRVVLELKSNADEHIAMAYLFKHTSLESRFHVNLTCLVPTDNPMVPAPEKLGLKDMLVHFLDFRLEIVTKRFQYDLRQLLKRIHILEGFELVFSDLDEAIKIIRASTGKAHAAKGLIAFFGIDEIQADAILETKLYRLAKLEIDSILEELEAKRAEAARIKKILADESELWGIIKSELRELKSAYGDVRRTKVDVEIENLEYDAEAYIINEETFVVVSREGWIKRQRSYSDVGALRVRDNDEIGWVLPGGTRATAMFFTSAGRCYTLRIVDIIQTTGYGDPLAALFAFSDGERVIGVATDDSRVLWSPPPIVSDQQTIDGEIEYDEPESPQFVAVSEKGQSVRFSLRNFHELSTKKGRVFMKLAKGDRVLNVESTIRDEEQIVIATTNGRGLIFDVNEISFMKNAAKGVRAITLEKGDTVLDFTLARDSMDGLEVETNRGARVVIRSAKAKFETSSRANKGRWIIKRGHLIRSHRPAFEICDESDEEE